MIIIIIILNLGGGGGNGAGRPSSGVGGLVLPSHLLCTMKGQMGDQWGGGGGVGWCECGATVLYLYINVLTCKIYIT